MGLGQRIKFFRTRVALSQLGLEIETGLAEGSVSRIESGKVNPSKETLGKLAAALKLDQGEKMALFGIGLEPPTAEEIKQVHEKLADYFKQPTTIALLLDNQWRMLEASRGMRNLFPFTDEQVDQILIGKNLLELIFDPRLGVRQFLDNLHELDRNEIRFFKTDMRFRTNEDWYKTLIERMKRFDHFNAAWEDTQGWSDQPYPTRTRIVKFKFGDKRISLVSNFTHYNPDPRFEILDYVVIQ